MAGMAAVKQSEHRRVKGFSPSELRAYDLGRQHMRMEVLDYTHAQYAANAGNADENPVVAFILKFTRGLSDHLRAVTPDVNLYYDDLPPLPPEDEQLEDRTVLTPRPGR